MSISQDLDKILEDALDDVPCPKCGNTFHDSKFIAYLENGNKRAYHCLNCGCNFVKYIGNDDSVSDFGQLLTNESIEDDNPDDIEPEDVPF